MVGHPTISVMKKTKQIQAIEPKSKPRVATGRTYVAKLDSKKRFLIRGAQHTYYHVEEMTNGKIRLTPKVLVDA